MIKDTDIMANAIIDARKLYFLHDSNGTPITGITDKDGNHHSYNSGESKERCITRLAVSLYEQRLKMLDRGEFQHITSDTEGNIELNRELNETLKQLAEERSWALLEKELGAETFQSLMTTKSVRLHAKNDTYFTIGLDGSITIEWKNGIIHRHHIKSGRIWKNNYTMADNLATIVKWIKVDPEAVYRKMVKHCGNIEVQGGELV